MAQRVLDFSFINQDVQTQLTQSKEIVAAVQSIQASLSNVNVPADARVQLEEAAKRLLGIASILTNNATTTSNTAALTIVSSTPSSS